MAERAMYTHFSFKVVTRVAFTCEKCEAQTIVDLVKDENQKKMVQAPKKACAVCGQNFPESLSEAFTQFIYWHESVAKSGVDVSLVVDA